MNDIQIIDLSPKWRDWANRVLAEHWCSTEIMSRFVWFDLTRLPGFIAVAARSNALVAQHGNAPDREPLGLATYHIENGECELITLNSFVENQGVGAELFYRVRELAINAGCTRYFLTTSNDNLRAMQFYQKRGMRMVKIHVGAIDAAREKKPGIPLVGSNGIPSRDEVEFSEELKAER